MNPSLQAAPFLAPLAAVQRLVERSGDQAMIIGGTAGYPSTL